jgi:hypothetical protein
MSTTTTGEEKDDSKVAEVNPTASAITLDLS